MSKQFDGLESIFVTPLGTAWKKAKAIFKPLSELLKAVEKPFKEAGKTYLEAEGAKENQAAAARRAEAIASAPTPQAAAQIASVPAYVAPPPKAIGILCLLETAGLSAPRTANSPRILNIRLS